MLFKTKQDAFKFIEENKNSSALLKEYNYIINNKIINRYTLRLNYVNANDIFIFEIEDENKDLDIFELGGYSEKSIKSLLNDELSENDMFAISLLFLHYIKNCKTDSIKELIIKCIHSGLRWQLQSMLSSIPYYLFLNNDIKNNKKLTDIYEENFLYTISTLRNDRDISIAFVGGELLRIFNSTLEKYIFKNNKVNINNNYNYKRIKIIELNEPQIRSVENGYMKFIIPVNDDIDAEQYVLLSIDNGVFTSFEVNNMCKFYFNNPENTETRSIIEKTISRRLNKIANSFKTFEFIYDQLEKSYEGEKLITTLQEKELLTADTLASIVRVKLG